MVQPAIVRAAIALGSNLGDRLAHLRAAQSEVVALKNISGPIRTSRVYETEPVGTDADAGAFLNAVIEVEFTGEPDALLADLQAIEAKLGRPSRHPRNASRTIDLDILYIGDRVLVRDAIAIPHPRLHLRHFVLAPLADICPRAILPGQVKCVADLLAELRDPAKVEVFAHHMNPSIAHLGEMKRRGEKIAMLTAYDYPTARLLDESGVDVLLVGDSLGMVVLGYPDTTLVTMDEMLHHTRAVARAQTKAPVLADLPIGTCDTPESALANGLRLMEAGASAVKLEGGASHAPQIAALTAAGIPAMAHIGMMPQRVRIEGGYHVKGKTPEDAARLLADARAAEKAGAFGLLLELIQADTARRITESVKIPTIGIGAGLHCDGQVLVTPDLIGAYPWFTPRFVKQRAKVAEEIRRAVSEYVAGVKEA